MCLQIDARTLVKKILPKIVFVNTNVPDKRIHVAKSQEELDDDSTDIFKSNIIKSYAIRPVLPVIDEFCLAEFAAHYYKYYKTDAYHKTKDCQPDVLADDLLELQIDTSETKCMNLPQRIK